MAICGAKTRNGCPCQKPPLKGKKRCRLHGGKSEGAPKKNKNSVKHNIYSKFLTAEENQIAENLDLTIIDNELKLTKIRLMRVMKLEQEQMQKEANDQLELQSLTTKPTLFGGIPDYSEDFVEEKTYIKKDYSALIDRYTARIASLTKLRGELIAQDISNQKAILEFNQLERELNGKTTDTPEEDYRLELRPDEDTPSEPIL